MSGDTAITLVGNLTADPELRFTQSGVPVADFTVASTPRIFDRANCSTAAPRRAPVQVPQRVTLGDHRRQHRRERGGGAVRRIP